MCAECVRPRHSRKQESGCKQYIHTALHPRAARRQSLCSVAMWNAMIRTSSIREGKEGYHAASRGGLGRLQARKPERRGGQQASKQPLG